MPFYLELEKSGGGGGGSPGGSNGSVQFNNSGSFGGFGSYDGSSILNLGTNSLILTDGDGTFTFTADAVDSPFHQQDSHITHQSVGANTDTIGMVITAKNQTDSKASQFELTPTSWSLGFYDTGGVFYGTPTLVTLQVPVTLNNKMLWTPISVPGSPVQGNVYFDSTTHAPYFYNGSAWVSMGGGGTNYWARTTTGTGSPYLSPATANDNLALGTGTILDTSFKTSINPDGRTLNAYTTGSAVPVLGWTKASGTQWGLTDGSGNLILDTNHLTFLDSSATTSLSFSSRQLNGTAGANMLDWSGSAIKINSLTASKVVFTDASKNLTSTGIGTSSQFIKGDGSLDSGSYVSISNFIPNETPSGTINGTNPTFTLANTPITGKVMVYFNGLRMKPTVDYTIAGGTISMIQIPKTNDSLLVDYWK